MRLLLLTLVFIGIFLPINAAKLKCGRTPIRPYVVPKPKIPGKFENRIAGGFLSVPNSWPWQVLLQWRNETWETSCGGTIIAKQWILTAAHCFRNKKSEEVKAYVSIQRVLERGEPLDVQKIYEHPLYDPETIDNDIKLIKLKHPIKYNNTVQPICLSSNDDDVVAPANTAWATGWGLTNANGTLNNELIEVNVPFVDIDTCAKTYEDPDLNDKYQICAGKKGKTVCQGDSGGPLVVESVKGPWFQHGITSFGAKVCGEGSLGVYTRVSAYCSWIKSTTRGAAYCHKL